MDNQRMFLFAALAFVLFLIYQAWVQDYGPKPQPPATAQQAPAEQSATPASSSADNDIPAPAPEEKAAPAKPEPEAEAQPLASAQPIHVHTDTLDVVIDTRGGDLRRVSLRKYPVTKNKPDQPVTLLTDHPDGMLVIQSGLRGADDNPAPSHHAIYQADATDYTLGSGQKELQVPLTWTGPDGVVVKKVYTFKRDSYQIGLTYDVHNAGGQPWVGDAYVQLRRHHQEQSHSMFGAGYLKYDNPALYNGDKYKKYDFKDLNETPISQTVDGGWAAIVQHYFLAAIIPPQDVHHRFYSKALGSDRYLLGYVTPNAQAAPGADATFSTLLFVGPKLQDRLGGIAPHLDRTVDYGMFTIFAEPLFKILKWVHSIVGNWGWSIVILTILIKLVFYKPSEISGKSTARMRKVQPRIKALKERYGDDKQRFQQAMMELYKKEKINPAHGCWPLLLQFPIYIALYWMLRESVELRQAPFMFWINDLSVHDPLYVLPALIGVLMFFQQRLNPTPADPVQAKVMMIMPLFMVGVSAFLPAGLTLYWFVNSGLSVAQQWQINRVVEATK